MMLAATVKTVEYDPNRNARIASGGIHGWRESDTLLLQLEYTVGQESQLVERSAAPEIGNTLCLSREICH